MPRTHGTGVFQRGETQALSITTLGAPGTEQIVDEMEVDTKKFYMHHYNFPAWSVGEVAPSRWPSRREIGHGHLAERAIVPVLPPRDQFPYVIRVVTEIMSANGSTSMASVCGSTLSLMDAGVPIQAPVAGVAMGLIMENGKHIVITDIQGEEDHLGDMDFKVAGTANGVTAMQMDIKVPGISPEIMKEAVQKALIARQTILGKMTAVIATPRTELSQYAPRIVTLKIDPSKIRDVIGKGGETINKIIDETGVDINIEDDGRVDIASEDAASLEKAVQWVRDLTREVKAGEMFKGKVVRIEDFGAFVNILPGQDGLVHISQLASKHVDRVEDVVKLGEIIDVVVTEIDELGRINLSHSLALQKLGIPEKKIESSGRPQGHSDRGDRGGRGGFGGRRNSGGRGGFRR